MKKGNIISGVVGAGFFAVPYIALNLSLAPSIVIGCVAFGAGKLLFKEKPLTFDLSTEAHNVQEVLKQGRSKTDEVRKICTKLEDKELVENVKKIYECSYRILGALEKNPDKIQNGYNFLNYYLPLTIKILNQYNEIEDQKLTSTGSREFKTKVKNLIYKIEIAFEKYLNSVYETKIMNTEAEIKVFETMLKTDGFLEDEIQKMKNNGDY